MNAWTIVKTVGAFKGNQGGEEAQQLLVEFVSFLKQRYPSPTSPEDRSEKTPYQKLKESGFIGCVSVEEDLSTTDKQVLAEELSAKYDHR